MRRLIVLALATLTIAESISAASSCGRWIPQVNGISWRMCTDAQGQRYCEMQKGREIKRMTCP
jgi:hypothetical protein